MAGDACRKCGAKMPSGAARCEWCGTERETARAAAAPDAPAPDTPAPDARAPDAPARDDARDARPASTPPLPAVPWAATLPGGAAAHDAAADASSLPPPAWLEPLPPASAVPSRQIRVPRPVLVLLGLVLLIPVVSLFVWLRTGPASGEIQFNPSVWTCAPGENRYGAFRLPDLPRETTLRMSLTDGNGWDWWGGYEMTLAELENYRFIDGRYPMAGPRDEYCRLYANGAYQMTIRNKATDEVLATGTVEISHAP